MPLPREWYDDGVAVRARDPRALATTMGAPVETFTREIGRFNQLAGTGADHDFHRGDSAHERYYGNPTIAPDPNLRLLPESLYAARGVLSDLGTDGGLMVDVRARVQREDGESIPALYAFGNAAANTFGRRYPGAGATIGHRLVLAGIAARHMAERKWHFTDGHWSPARSSGRNLRRRRSAPGRRSDSLSEGGTHCVKSPRRALMMAGRVLTIDCSSKMRSSAAP